MTKRIGSLMLALVPVVLMVALSLPAAAQKIVQGAPSACGGVYGFNTLIIDSPENILFPCGGMGTVPVPGLAWMSSITSNTAQATANVTTDQLLLAATIGMPTAQWAMNLPGRSLEYYSAGVYNLGVGSTVNIKLKLCSVSGCGSGTVVTLMQWTTASQATTGVTLGFNLNAWCVTVTPGATGTAECHGTLEFDSGATLAAAGTSFQDSNIAVVSGLPLNGQWFLQATLAFGTANASNTASLRNQLVSVYGPGIVN